MIVLYILLGIILFLLLLLLIPFSVNVLFYDGDIEVKLKYAFIKYTVNTDDNEIEKDTVKDVEKAEKDGRLKRIKNKIFGGTKKIIKEKNVKIFFFIIKDLTKIIASDLCKVIKKIKIKELDIYYVVSSEEIGNTAIQYAKACAVIYPFVSILKEKIGGKNIRASVELDYKLKSSIIKVETEFSIVPIFVLFHGAFLIKKVIPYVNKLKLLV